MKKLHAILVGIFLIIGTVFLYNGDTDRAILSLLIAIINQIEYRK